PSAPPRRTAKYEPCALPKPIEGGTDGGDNLSPTDSSEFTCCSRPPRLICMFSHVVILWTDPAKPDAVAELLAGAGGCLRPIPGIVAFHAGKMVGSLRPVVDQTYQVALNVIFSDKAAQDQYQTHPLHVEFVEKVLRPAVKKILVYDFE